VRMRGSLVNGENKEVRERDFDVNWLPDKIIKSARIITALNKRF
jgi:hypothetical protein